MSSPKASVAGEHAFGKLLRLNPPRFFRRVLGWATRKTTRTALSIRYAIVKSVVLPAICSPRLERYQAYPCPRRQPLFLILRNKYCEGRERYGPSNEEHVISSPLKSAGVAETVEYYYDLDYSPGLFGDSRLVNLVRGVRPDLIVLSSYGPFDKRLPQLEVLRTIRSKCGIPIIAIWFDGYGDIKIEASAAMSGVVDLNILVDSGFLADHFSDKPNYLYLWPPLDFSVFFPVNGTQDIPVSFLGSTGAYRDMRKPFLSYLEEQKLPLYRAGGQREQLVSLEEYADILRRSKISLNFSYCPGGLHQLKGRVFEVMFSRALLLETENTEITRYFTPMVDYVPFDSKEDLADKVRYYLQHEDEREQIALNGYTKATEQYNHEEFWSRVLGKAADLKLLASPLAARGE